MGLTILDVVGSYRTHAVSGLATTIAAGTGTAGHMFAARNPSSSLAMRLRKLEVACVCVTAFGAAQEVGFDLFAARSYASAHTGGSGVVPTRERASMPVSVLTSTTVRVCGAGELTAVGPPTLDTDRIASDSFWATLGAGLARREYDFSNLEAGGLIFVANEGIILRNTILMGASGVVRWQFTMHHDDVLLGN